MSLRDTLAFSLTDPPGRTIGGKHDQRHVQIESLGDSGAVIEGCGTGGADQYDWFPFTLCQSGGEISCTPLIHNTEAMK